MAYFSVLYIYERLRDPSNIAGPGVTYPYPLLSTDLLLVPVSRWTVMSVSVCTCRLFNSVDISTARQIRLYWLAPINWWSKIRVDADPLPNDSRRITTIDNLTSESSAWWIECALVRLGMAVARRIGGNWTRFCNDTERLNPSCLKPEFLYVNEHNLVVFGYVMPVLVLLTVVTNCLVCAVLLRHSMRTPTNVILVAMAVSDMLTGVSSTPAFIKFFTLGEWVDFMPYDWFVTALSGKKCPIVFIFFWGGEENIVLLIIFVI